MGTIFRDRRSAGRQLARKLATELAGIKEPTAVVYGLPRGGVIVALQVARRFDLPLGIVITRKIGMKSDPECGIGAVTEDGTLLLNGTGRLIDPTWLRREARRQQKEARRRRVQYLKGSRLPTVSGKTVILVDDGIATGLTLSLAIDVLRKEDPARIVIAVPVALNGSLDSIACKADACVVLMNAWHTGYDTVGNYYRSFRQVSDQRVRNILKRYLPQNGS